MANLGVFVMWKAACSWLVLILCLVNSVEAGDYLVIDLVGADDPYYAAAKRLATLRKADIVSADIQDLNSLLAVLRTKQPGNVAIVVRPDDFDVNLARQLLK